MPTLDNSSCNVLQQWYFSWVPAPSRQTFVLLWRYDCYWEYVLLLTIRPQFMELGSLYDVLHNEFIPVLPFPLESQTCVAGAKLHFRQRPLKRLNPSSEKNPPKKKCLQAAQGMNFLHVSDMIHRDLKSPNILLDAQWNAKISDFGLTTLRDPQQDIPANSMSAILIRHLT